MERKKINIGVISKTLSRSEMRQIMAGSQGSGGGGGTGSCTDPNAVFCQCDYGGPYYSACATFDGSSPFNKCAQLVCGGMVMWGNWGIDWFCSDCP